MVKEPLIDFADLRRMGRLVVIAEINAAVKSGDLLLRPDRSDFVFQLPPLTLSNYFSKTPFFNDSLIEGSQAFGLRVDEVLLIQTQFLLQPVSIVIVLQELGSVLLQESFYFFIRHAWGRHVLQNG